MKLFSDKVLSKKTTLISVIAVTLFVICGMVAAIVGHTVYLRGREAKITNYSVRENSDLLMRRDGVLSYRYDDGMTSVDAADLVRLSDGAVMKVLCVVTEDDISLQKTTTVDLCANPHVYMYLSVTGEGGKNQTNYILEIVPKSAYQEEQRLPSILLDDGPFIQQN